MNEKSINIKPLYTYIFSFLICVASVLISSCDSDMQKLIKKENDFSTDEMSNEITRSSPVPGNSGELIIVNLKPESLTLVWSPAVTEGVDTSLTYSVFSGDEYFQTPDEVEDNCSRLLDWTPDITFFEVLSLEESRIYIFYVIVKDNFGQKSLYEPREIMTPEKPDITLPEAGNFGLITVMNALFHTVEIAWTEGSDNETETADLAYRVFRSESNNINSYANALEYGTPVNDWTAAISSCTAGGLLSSTTYYFNIFVRDLAGNVSSYVAAEGTTINSDVIFLFSAGLHNGNLGGRVGADRLCYAAASNLPSEVQYTNVRAFISAASDDEINNMTSTFGVPGDRNIVGVTGKLVGQNWADLFDGAIHQSLANGQVVDNAVNWWSGSNVNGESMWSDPTMGPSNNCSDWSVGTSIDEGWSGFYNVPNSRWIDEVEVSCNELRNVLCVAW